MKCNVGKCFSGMPAILLADQSGLLMISIVSLSTPAKRSDQSRLVNLSYR